MLRKLRALCAAASLAIALASLHTPEALAQATQLPPAEQCFQATTGINGMVGTLGAITAGSGGTNGTYTNVALTGGSGTTATANITVASNHVTAVTILNPGINYVVGDTLSAASGSIGGTTGFSIPVASISINSSLAGGTVGMYTPNTLTFAQTWQDSAQTTLNTNPIALDANGCALIYGVGTYRQILFDSLGNEVWDRPTSVAPVTPFWAGLASGTGNAVTVTDTGFTGADGQSIAFIAAASNTGAVTFNPSSFGNIPVVKDTSAGPVALTVGDIATSNVVQVTYVASQNQFHMVGGGSSGITGKFASSCGVVTNGLTDDTAAWNTCVSYANSHPGTYIIASAGTSKITALNALTASNSFIACINGPGACTLAHSGSNALSWSGGVGGGLIDMALNNTGTACNVSIFVHGNAQQLQFNNLVLGAGIGTLATLGATGDAAGTTHWTNLTSPGGVANAACPLYNLVNGFAFVLQDSIIYVNGKGIAGRTFITSGITGPNSWDALQIQNNIIEFFTSIMGGTLSNSGLLLDAKIDGNFLDNCIGPCINLSVTNSSTVSAFAINNNWMDNDTGLTDCIDILQGTGSGNIIGTQILGNRINTCGGSGISLGGATSSMRDTSIISNQIYNINMLNTGTTYGVLVEGDGADGVFITTQISENQVSAPGWSAVFSPYHNPTYGIAVIVPAAGGLGAQYVQMQGNSAVGQTANFLLPLTISNSRIEGNLGLASTGATISVGASPFTYTAGAQPETVYIRAGTVSAVVQNATTLCAASPCTVNLYPNEAVTVTYSGGPTMTKILH